MKHITHNTYEVTEVAREVLVGISKGETAVVLALSGELGAGKTTFTKELAKLLGVERIVASPTFVIERVYPIDTLGFKNLIHIDAYRMESEEEITRLGWNDIIADPENIICIEWPEKVSEVIPENATQISFEHGEKENERIIELNA